ncbi:hypothetical protein COCCADRAFT_112758 [Bipolaris zeicola 26-R-13]|uniref:Oxidoreductase n=1 Tax=Cochliobolus carbonum (strain 26-R-13) TaxID=930089 RepID=W6Y6T2_COCC2|nr:uncharacterized protein COCCADRAFT_112758 [Bipolaris zeicola 26-R-13]EUC27026.1 hypothetical protein COCCADRAFT_112758 [Bipolaris zeicola 26-R-13]
MSAFRPSAHALITGGASGIGHAIARLCLSHSMRVTITDTNETLLSQASTSLSGNLTCIAADVTSRSDWVSLKQRIGSDIDLLVLNAGISGKGTWGDAEYFDSILSTNLGGVVNGLNAFVPVMREKEGAEKAIVITGSKQGITNPPGNAAYNASKAAVKTLAEHLSFDLKDTGVGVHLLVPGWTFTPLAGKVPGSDAPVPEGAWSPDQVAEYMYEKMKDGKFYIVCPDGQVSEETDKKRMLWSVGDIINGRPPLTRWRPEYKEEAEKWMAEQKV